MFRELVGFEIMSEEDRIHGMDVIHEQGVKDVVVTSGVEGS